MDGAPLARVVLLGGFAVEPAGAQPGSTLAGLPRGVQRLVAYLGLADRPTRAAVAGRLWPDVPEERAHGSLRSALWRLHQVAPGLVEVSGGALFLARGVRVDVREFIQWARCVLEDRKSTRLNSSHANISYAVFCLKKKNQSHPTHC